MKRKNISFALKIFFHILLGVVLGCSMVMLHISSNGTLQDYIVKELQKSFLEKYNCRITCQLDKIDWLFLRMHFSKLKIEPQEKNIQSHNVWSITADKFTVAASWWSLITQFRCKLSGALDHVIMRERYQHQPGEMFAFLAQLFKRTPGNFLEYDWMSISEALFLLQQENGCTIQIPYMCNISSELDSARMQLYAQNGKIIYKDIILLDAISGSVICDVPEKDIVKRMYVQTNMSMNCVGLAEKGQLYLLGTMKHGLGSFNLKNEDLSFVIDPIEIRADSKKCLFDMSITTSTDLCKQLNMHDVCKQVQGLVQLDVRGDLYDFLKTVQIDVSVDDVAYKRKTLIKDAKIFVQYQQPGILTGQLATGEKQWFEFQVCTQNNKPCFTFFNNKDLMLSYESYWKIPAKKCSVEVKYDQENSWKSSYEMHLYNDKLQEQKLVRGTCFFSDKKIVAQGNIDDITYDIVVGVSPVIMPQKILFQQGEKKLVDFSFNKQQESHLVGNIDFACIHYMVSPRFKSSFAQEGVVKFQGYIKNGVYYSQLSSTDANIRIPRIYNVIQNITASCELDIYNRYIKLKDVKTELHEGEIVCSQANFFFDKSGSCSFMHVPLLLHNVLLSWDRGIFMLLSGGLLLDKQEQEGLRLQGQIIVEKSQLKENLFSSEFQEKLFGTVLEYDDKDPVEKNCSFDISLITKDLLQVKTSFLSSKARLDLQLKGTLKKPELLGLIQLVSGSFYFPYKSLDIIDGKLFFVPDQQFDPLMEIVARGKLKRYGVTMHVTGSVFDPYVQFDAAPYLTEEQILSLLLLGIEDSSLSVMVPALLTQKLKDLVFGPALSKTTLQSRFETLLQSFKHFRFLPQFTNQAGRGGMRGVFEIDASDHLHGKIDTNFMQLEDTKFDVDFAVTDDVTLRVQKDGPSTYGGEVELRWKF